MNPNLPPILVCVSCLLIACNTHNTKTPYKQNAIDLNNKAVKLFQTRQFDSALVYLDQAIQIDTTYYLPYVNKCNIYRSLGDYKNALVAAKHAIRVKPDLAKGWTMAGMLHDKLGDTITALDYYKKSIALFDERISNPNKQKDIEANKLNRAFSLMLSGEEATGRKDLRNLIEINPSNKQFESLLHQSRQEFLNEMLDK